MKQCIILSSLLFAFCCATSAQDPHFSQFHQNLLRFNPALAGVHRGDFRAALQYRSQWNSVPVPYKTFAASSDYKFIKRGNNLLAGALTLEHDRAGDAALTWSQAAVNLSVVHALSTRFALSAGLGMGLVQRRFDISKLSFKNQWNGDIYDPSLPSKELFGRQSGPAGTLSCGINLHHQQTSSRSNWNLGFAAAHLNRPDLSFEEDKAFALPLRLNLNVTALLQASEYVDLLAFGLGQRMGKAQEIVFGAGAKLWLLREIGQDLAIQFNLGMRLGDAIIPSLLFERNEWTLGISYDFNISRFDIATGGKGGIELSAVYQAIPAPTMRPRRICPIF